MTLPTFRDRYDTELLLPSRAALLLDYAEAAMQSHPEELAPLLTQTRDDCAAAGLEVEAAFCDRLLGWLAYDRSDYPMALELFENALAAFMALSHVSGRLKALNGIASVYSEQGRLESALSVFRSALSLAEEAQEDEQALLVRANIGGTLSKLQQFQEAEPFLRAGLDSGRLSPLNECMGLTDLAKALIPQGKRDEARTVLLRAVELARRGPFPSSLGTALDALGALDLDRPTAETESLLREAREVSRKAGARAPEAQATLDLGRLLLGQGETADALLLLRDARDLAVAIGAHPLEAEIWRWTATARKKMEHWKEALDAQERWHELLDRLREERLSRQVAQLRADQGLRETELLKEQTRVLTLLGELGQKITASLDIDHIILTVYGSIGGLMKADTFGLGLYDAARGVIQYRLFLENGHRFEPFELPVEDSTLSGWCVRHRQDVFIDDSDVELHRYLDSPPPRFGNPEKRSRSCLYTPLLSQGEVIGVLSAQSYEPHAYQERHLATFKTLAASLSVAVQNARLFQQVVELATVDSLTGAVTRRHLFERTEEEFQRFLRDGVSLALVMIDLDGFKALNDNWGHVVGDQVLREFGALCLRLKRPHDLFGRYGGEEFALLLAGTTLEGAHRSASRLKDEVEKLPLEGPDGTPIPLTASFGVTVFQSDDADITRVFSRADAALYEAKQTGRNRVVTREP